MRGSSPGGDLLFSCIRRLGSLFWVQSLEFRYFWVFSEKMNILGGYEEFVDIGGGGGGVIIKLDYV